MNDQHATTTAAGAPHLDDDSLKALLAAGGDEPLFVDFYAEWCGPCKLAAPIIDKLAVEYAGKVKIAKLDVDANINSARELGVMSIPTVIVFQKKGDKLEEVDRKIGFPGEQGYREMLTQVLGDQPAA
jgi:thioredoxin 1